MQQICLAQTNNLGKSEQPFFVWPLIFETTTNRKKITFDRKKVYRKDGEYARECADTLSRGSYKADDILSLN